MMLLIARKPGVNNEVIGAKFDEQYEEDIANNVARFGGHRQPSYARAYLRAARILVDQAIQTNDLDQLALPIFYLHRHTVELLLKRLLSSLYELAELRHDYYKDEVSRENLPKEQQLKTLHTSHNLKDLYRDLNNIAIKLNYDNLPESIKELPELIKKYEITETWSRYPYSGNINQVIHHTKNEIVLPVLEIHKKIEDCINESIPGAFSDVETYEHVIWSEFNSLMTLIEFGPDINS